MWIFVVYAGSWTLATPATWMLLYKLSSVCPPLFQPWCASLTAFQSRKLQMPMYSNTLTHTICQCATDAEKVLGLLVTTGVVLGAARCFLYYWIDRQCGILASENTWTILQIIVYAWLHRILSCDLHPGMRVCILPFFMSFKISMELIDMCQWTQLRSKGHLQSIKHAFGVQSSRCTVNPLCWIQKESIDSSF